MNKILIVAGATAVGKTEYAIELANYFNGEIVSCDSMQLYKFMDIGSAKPTTDELKRAKHYLVDEIDPRDEFSVATYSSLARKYIDEILEKNKLPIIAGGTGLYMNSIIYDMDFSKVSKNEDLRKKYEKMSLEKGNEYIHNILTSKSEELGKRIHKNNLQKMIRALEVLDEEKEIPSFRNSENKKSKYEPVMICLNRDRKELYDRINLRVDLLMEKGLLDEVRSLLDMGLTRENISMKGIGYKELIDYIEGRVSLEVAISNIKQNTRKYAKRQLTWFRRYEDMKWFDLPKYDLGDIIKWLQKRI